QDGADGAVGPGTDLEASGAGSFETLGAVLARQAQDADASPVTLLGMRPALQDEVGQQRGARPDAGGVALDALDGPAGMARGGARHGRGGSGGPPPGAAANMAGDALALVEQLDGALSDAGLDLLLQQPVRHRVVVALDVHVVVEPDPAQPPLGIDIGFAA